MTRWWYATVALVVAAAAGSYGVYHFAYDRLPERIPIHWGISGEPDGWVGKDSTFVVFALWPLIMAGLAGLAVVLPWLSPKHFAVEPFRATADYIFMLAVALMGFLFALSFWGALDPELPQGKVLMAGLFLFFGLLGNVLGRVRRNFYIGIRTPWTLANEAVWDRTHRLGAWLMTGAGAVGFVAALAGVPGWICFTVLMVAVLFPVLYSLVLYKRLERAGQLG